MDAPRVSAKTGLNVDQVLERVVIDISSPTGDPDAPLKALIFDSIYDLSLIHISISLTMTGTVSKPANCAA